MKDRLDTVKGKLDTVEVRTNLVTGEVQIFEGYSELDAGIDQLKVVVDVVDGDRKAPNPHDYITFKSEGLPYRYYSETKDLGWLGVVTKTGRVIHGQHGTDWIPLNLEEDSNQLRQTEDQALKGLYEQMRGHANAVVDIIEGKEVVKLVRDAVSMKRNWVARMGKAMGITVRHNRRAGEVIFRDKRGGQMSMGSLEWRQAAKRSDGTYDFRKQRVIDIANFSSEISSLWLEYRYGVTPLVLSIADAIDLAVQPLRKGGGLHTVQSRSQKVSERAWSTEPQGDGAWNEINERLTTRVEFQTRYVLPPDIIELYDTSTLNPVSIGWELLPVISIVGDWMFEISDYLRNLESALIFASGFRGGYKTITFERVTTFIARQNFESAAPFILDGVKKIEFSGGFVKTVRQKRRTVLVTPPFPNMPTLRRDNMPWKRVADVGAFFTLMATDLGKTPGRI